MAIGSDLREAREQRGLTLRDISERTKIRQAVLRAIESDDFKGLPGSVIMRGFLKLYAREVGLDPDEIGRRYTAEVELPAAVEPLSHAQAGAGLEGESARRLRTLALVAAAVIGLLFVGYRFWSAAPMSRSVTETARQSAPPTTTPAPSTAPVEAAAPGSPPPGAAPAEVSSPPAASAPLAAAPAAEVSAAEGLRVEIQATEASWVAATADGQQAVYRVVGAGEKVEMRVKKEAVLRIGVPSGVNVSVNGRPLKPYGRPGMPTTLRITPDNYRDLLVP